MNVDAYCKFYSLTQEPNISITVSCNSLGWMDELQDGLGKPYGAHSGGTA